MIRAGTLPALALTVAVAATQRGSAAQADALDSAAMQFQQATELLHSGDYAAAADEFEQLAVEFPDSRYADDALFEVARIWEERLFDPRRALQLYDQLVQRYPNSREALAASRRAKALRVGLGPDAQGALALAEFQEILQTFPSRPESESIALVEQLLRDHPRWVGAQRAVLWLAAVYRRTGELPRAEARYREATERWPDSPQVSSALRGAGDVAIMRRSFARAQRYYQAMPPGVLRSTALAHYDRELTRWRAYQLCYLLLGAAILALALSVRHATGSWSAATGALRTVPTEVIYLAPVALLLFGAALTGHEQIAPAAAIILIAGLVLTWLSGAGLKTKATGGRVLCHLGACTVGVLAATYIALHRSGLLDLIERTVQFGPELR